MPTANPPLIYRYTFLLGNGQRKTFELPLDPVTLALLPPPVESYPSWAELSCCRCPHCPLDPREHAVCPIAANVLDCVEFFRHVVSYDQVDVEIASQERSYVKRSPTSEAVSSLLGIYMVTSGCPIMDKLRPMVRFHLPLATPAETTFRAVAMYLVAQYFVQLDGGLPDWKLAGLRQIYRDVQQVNAHFAGRLQRATDNDASINAIVRLDALASTVVLSIELENLQDLRGMFGAYLTSGA